jgi:hypothetical protein
VTIAHCERREWYSAPLDLGMESEWHGMVGALGWIDLAWPKFQLLSLTS